MAAERSFKIPTVPVGRRRVAASPSKMDSEESTSKRPVETATEIKTETSPDKNGSPCAGGVESVAVHTPKEEGSTEVEPQSHGGEELPQEERTKSVHGDSKDYRGRQPKEVVLPTLPYSEPQWSAPPTEPYSLTVIKNGTVVQEVNISNKAFHVFGRLPVCDVSLEHPSISRYHAVLQCRPQDADSVDAATAGNHTLFSTNPTEAGLYVYDLGSTHGTFLNKNKIQPRCYYRLRVGQMVRFGGSSRMFVLEAGSGSQEQVEAEAQAEIQVLERQRVELERRRVEVQEEQERAAREREEMGVSWGMVMDLPSRPEEEEEEEMEIDPEREAYYKDDPKKALKKFFDREGLELEYETEEEGPLHARAYTVRVRLPIDTATGEPVYAEGTVRGKKKEAVVQCALNACRILDTQGMLRKANQGHKRKVKSWEENDYYDSDEDTFLDRTGEIEKKRKQRMRKAGRLEETAENYHSLQTKLTETHQEIRSLEDKLARALRAESLDTATNSLDSFMSTLTDQLDRGRKADIKHQLHSLKKEEERLMKLIEIVRPAELPSLSSPTETSPSAVKGSPSPREKRALHSSFTSTQKKSLPSTHTETTTAAAHSLSPEGSNDIPERERDYSTTHSEGKSPSKGSRQSEKFEAADNDSTPAKECKLVGPTLPDVTPKDHKLKESEEASPAVKKQRFLGPTLPPEVIAEHQTLRERKSGKRKRSAEGEPSQTKKKPVQWETDPDYSTWLPPTNQSGDGKTHLNEKYGY